MYIDKQAEFSDAQAVTSTAISSNVYDTFSMAAGAEATIITSNTRLDLGAGEDVYLIVNTQTTATDSGDDATLTISFESADDAGLTTNAIVHYSTGALAFATFATAGTNLVKLKLPLGGYRRYIGVRYTVASGPLTAGKFDAFLTIGGVDNQRVYKSGFTVQ